MSFRMKPRQTLENKKQELQPIAKDIKTAVYQAEQLNIPIERVIYINDAHHVKHIPGTNRYTVNFPETFMTSNTDKKVIGIRSIQLRHSKMRTFAFKMNWLYYGEDGLINKYINQFDIDKPFEFSMTYTKNENPDISTWVDILNESWLEYANNFKNINEYKWTYDYDDSLKQYIIQMRPKLSLSDINKNPIQFRTKYISPDLINTDVKIESKKYHCTLPGLEDDEHAMLPYITIQGPLDAYEEYLVAASFVEQTSHNYLGFTNMTFTPPKLYHLTSTDMSFWIDLVSPDGLTPRELPIDGSDLLLLEIQLLIQPNMTKY